MKPAIINSMKNNSGFSYLEILIFILTTTLLCYSSLEVLKFRNKFEHRYFAQRLFLCIHQLSINAMTVNKDISVFKEKNIIYYQLENQTKLELIKIPPPVKVLFKFSAVKNDSSFAQLYSSGIKTPGKIEINQDSDKCDIVLGLRNNAKLLCS